MGDDSDFMLYGGTALALHYGHRISVDFDFFGSAQVTPALMQKRIWLRALCWFGEGDRGAVDQATRALLESTAAQVGDIPEPEPFFRPNDSILASIRPKSVNTPTKPSKKFV